MRCWWLVGAAVGGMLRLLITATSLNLDAVAGFVPWLTLPCVQCLSLPAMQSSALHAVGASPPLGGGGLLSSSARRVADMSGLRAIRRH